MKKEKCCVRYQHVPVNYHIGFDYTIVPYFPSSFCVLCIAGRHANLMLLRVHIPREASHYPSAKGPEVLTFYLVDH